MKIQAAVFTALVLSLAACSILKKENEDQVVHDYLNAFEANLSKSDDEILSQFRVKQSREAVLMIVGILQNKDPFIVCEANMNAARLTRLQQEVQVVVPVVFRLKELASQDSAVTSLNFTLSHEGETLVITELEGEKFYQEFTLLKNRTAWEAEEKLALTARAPVYENAARLEQMFDSVVWFTSYDEQNYFYVVAGEWKNLYLDYNTKNEQNLYGTMGLADQAGQLIIPLTYDLIGTIGFVERDLVEITRDHKVGYFDIKKRQEIIEPVYDQLIYYGGDNIWAVAKKDTTVGWVDSNFEFHAGFQSDKLKSWYLNFEYLKKTIHLTPQQYAYCEIPHADYAGSGILIPPAYLNQVGIFAPIESGYSSLATPIGGYSWTDYKETTGSMIETLSSNLKAVITTIKERYLEGREEFYTYNNVTFVDSKNNKIGTSRIPGESPSILLKDSTLLEVRSPHDDWFFIEGLSEETNLYEHSYFRIADTGVVEPLASRRRYAQTEFVRLDSSYLSGDFTTYHGEEEQRTTFLGLKTITYMRDEILGAYGYVPEQGDENTFAYLREQNLPTYKTVAEIDPLLSEIDRHNLAFLNKVIDLLSVKPAI